MDVRESGNNGMMMKILRLNILSVFRRMMRRSDLGNGVRM